MTYPSGRVASALDGLVADARSSRDGVFNTLDAVQRQATTAADELKQRIEKFRTEHSRAGAPPSPARVRDSRFDPEDEWEVAGPAAVASGAAASNAPRGSGSTSDDDDSDDGYAQTWLR